MKRNRDGTQPFDAVLARRAVKRKEARRCDG
jgi:hypothetical protein